MKFKNRARRKVMNAMRDMFAVNGAVWRASGHDVCGRKLIYRPFIILYGRTHRRMHIELYGYELFISMNAGKRKTLAIQHKNIIQ